MYGAAEGEALSPGAAKLECSQPGAAVACPPNLWDAGYTVENSKDKSP